MEFSDFLKKLLGIGLDFEVSKVTTEEKSKEINIGYTKNFNVFHINH